MIDTKELRKKLFYLTDLTLEAWVIEELLDRIEEAEPDCIEQALLLGMGSSREAALMAKLEAAEKTKSDWLRANAPGGWIDALRLECDYLRTKVEAMERQEPVAIVESWANGSYSRNYKLRWLKDAAEGTKLYALPGAKGE